MIATDVKGASTTESFHIVVSNNIPTVIDTVSDITVFNQTQFTMAVDYDTIFQDSDTSVTSQTLTYSIENSTTPFWTLTWSGNVATLTGIPSDAHVRDYTVTLKAYDGYDFETTDFIVTVAYNYPPTATSVTNIDTLQDQTTNFDISSFAFSDTEGDTLSFTVVLSGNVPLSTKPWISFDSSTMILTVTPPETASSVTGMEVHVDDSVNNPVVFLFNINVDKVPQASTTLTSGIFIAQQLSNFALSGSMFSDEDTTLTYELSK